MQAVNLAVRQFNLRKTSARSSLTVRFNMACVEHVQHILRFICTMTLDTVLAYNTEMRTALRQIVPVGGKINS